MRDSRLPRGTWIAPGTAPSSHSSRSRTSTKSGGARRSSGSRASVDVDLVDLGLAPGQQLSVASASLSEYSTVAAGECCRATARARVPARSRRRCSSPAPSRSSSPPLVARSVVAARGATSDDAAAAGAPKPRAGLAAARARPRRPHRRARRGTCAARSSSTTRGKRAAGGGDLRPLRLARGAARRARSRPGRTGRVTGRAARRALPAQRARPAPSRARAASGPADAGAADGVAPGARRRAGHAVRRHAPATCSIRSSRRACRSSSPSFAYRIDGETPAGAARARCAADRSVRRPAALRVALQRLGRPVSARRAFAAARGWRRTTSTRWSPTPSGASTRAIRPAPSRRLGPLSRALPAVGDRALPPRPPPALAAGREGGEAPARLARAAEPGSTIAGEAKRVPRCELATAGTADDKMGRTAYGASAEFLASSRSFARSVANCQVATTVRARSEGEPK